MNKVLRFRYFTHFVCLMATHTALASVIYVNISSNAIYPDGLSWATAYRNIEDAITVAQPNDQIWVAQGTYHPSTYNRYTSYTINKDLSLYGGFVGTELSLNERDPVTNHTVLSGDIVGDNSIHIVHCSGIIEVTIDGFTIRDGYAHSASGLRNDQRGAGIYAVDHCLVNIYNCAFVNNIAETRIQQYTLYEGIGAAIYAFESSINLVDCEFSNNYAGSYGGAVAVLNIGDLGGPAELCILRCVFNNNSCGTDNQHLSFGGSVFSGSFTKLYASESYFYDNSSNYGGSICAEYTHLCCISSCRFENSEASRIDGTVNGGLGGGVFIAGDPWPEYPQDFIISECLFIQNNAYYHGSGLYVNTGPTLEVESCDFINNGNYDCEANQSELSGALHVEYINNLRINKCRFYGNVAPGGSAANVLRSNLIMYNTLFSGNKSICNNIIGTNAMVFFGNPHHNNNNSCYIANCTFANNYSEGDTGLDALTLQIEEAEGVMYFNNILWDSLNDQHELLLIRLKDTNNQHAYINYNNIKYGETGIKYDDQLTIEHSEYGNNNTNMQPYFVDPTGIDGIHGTLDDDLRLVACLSPGIDAGYNSAIDVAHDLDNNFRKMNGPDTKRINDIIVDMGAYEHYCYGDITCDGVVNLDDLAELIAMYGIGITYYEGDLDCDGDVDINDLAELISPSIYNSECEKK